MHAALEGYHHAEAARLAYDFAWDEFCSYYVEMAKPRLNDPEQRAATQQVLIHTLDQLLRLLHPMIPFITEAIWQELASFGPVRTLDGRTEEQPWLICAAWPSADMALQDPLIESQFGKFAAVLGALREIRSRQNIPPKEEVSFTVACDSQTSDLLEPMGPFFSALARATTSGLGSGFSVPDMPASINVDGMEVTVDLGKFIDVDAEIQRNEKLQENLAKQIEGKLAKLGNENFVSRHRQTWSPRKGKPWRICSSRSRRSQLPWISYAVVCGISIRFRFGSISATARRSVKRHT